jgi:hypothetical protein
LAQERHIEKKFNKIFFQNPIQQKKISVEGVPEVEGKHV